MPPRKPQLATAKAAELEYIVWDDFVSEAIEGTEPFRMLLPGDAEPTVFPCPTGAQMEALGLAQQSMDDAAAFTALFGEVGKRLIELSAPLPFTVRAKLMQKVMVHYGLQMESLPES